MAKYEDKRVLATNGKTYLVRAADYELAETLHEMWEDYTDDIEENALRIARHVEARASEQGVEMREALERIIDHAEDWHAHYCEMWGERRKEQQDAILGDIMNARALLARESTEPADGKDISNGL